MRRNPTPSSVSPAERAVVVELAAKVGAAEAGRRTGHSASKIRTWTSRQGQAGAAAVAAINPRLLPSTPGNRWAEVRPAMTDALASAASEALDAMRAAIVKGDSRAAKDYSVAMAVAVDKAQLLSGAATARTQTETRNLTFAVHRTDSELAAEIAAVRADLVGLGSIEARSTDGP